MLNPEQKLREDLFEAKEQKPTRDGFGSGLVEAAQNDPRIVALCADLTESTRMEEFKKKFPERFVEIGVAEQNLVTVASGMAAFGKIPFITSYATFSPGRNNEQIRTTVSINEQPVKVVGSHAGISVGPDGATHQALEDIALMRVQPNMTIVSPCDAEEARKATIAIAQTKSPAYIRLGREKTPLMTTTETPFEFGKANVVWKNDAPQVAIFATGPLLFQALLAARELEGQGIGATVVNVHTIKPLDEETIVREAQQARAVVTVEEHQVAGGLGGAIAELLAQRSPMPIEFVGVRDRFGQSGTMQELLKEYGLDAPAITESVRKVISKK
ncbi:MAG: transketolase C-terminal domain-containing protein [Candidatus Pacebacteria bacterium]|nr:transketolase C-terminal domain-containing protein [Candidatus Paceibacterota bacterium]